MSKGTNVKFIEKYIILENAANALMNKKSSGVSAYISELESLTLDADAKKTLKLLKKCRFVRNKLAHDPGALKSNDEITNDDVRFIKKLTSDIQRRRDPLSRLLNKAPSSAAKIKAIISLAAVAAVIIAAIIFFIK
ncbi:MAG: hypothetical protein IKB38_05690 [Clostridia bacterium]|nr:hypothetical protein [Clostridia bacterium]